MVASPIDVITYLLAIGRRGTPRRRYLTSAPSWSPDRSEARPFFDRVTMRAAQLEQSREETRRIRVVVLRPKG